MHMDSYDENGPLTACGSVSFSARANNLPGAKHVFEMPTFMVATEESKVIVEYNGVRLRDFGTHNDYYGFGTSARYSLSDAKSWIEKLDGLNADIMVLSKIKMQPCIISKDEPFYHGAQRIHYIPRSWSHNRHDLKETEEEFVVWQNGGPTGDAGAFYDRIKDLVLSDAAPSRKGELRSIIAGKAPLSSANFLSPPN